MRIRDEKAERRRKKEEEKGGPLHPREGNIRGNLGGILLLFPFVVVEEKGKTMPGMPEKGREEEEEQYVHECCYDGRR